MLHRSARRTRSGATLPASLATGPMPARHAAGGQTLFSKPPEKDEGGVTVDKRRETAVAVPDTFVAVSAIFNAPNYQEVIDKMRSELALARP